MRPIRIGIAGIRSRGGLAYYLHRPEQRQVVAAAYDADSDVLAMARESFGPELVTCPTFAALLEQDLDAILVATPDREHELQILQALDKGLAILCHGPFSLRIEGLDRVVAEAHRKSQLLMSFQSLRQTDFLQKVDEIIRDDVIGPVKAIWCRHYLAFGGDAYFKDWPSDADQSLGLLLHAGYKDFDALQWLAGAAPLRVHAMGGLTVYGNLPRRAPGEKPDARQSDSHWPPHTQHGFHPEMNVEDLSMVQLAMDNGVLCSYQQCHYAPDSWRSYTIIGERGRIENRGNEPGFASIWIWTKRHDYFNPEGDGRIEIPKVEDACGESTVTLPDYRVMDQFIAKLRQGDRDTKNLRHQRDAMAAAIVATHSLREGGAVKAIPPMAVAPGTAHEEDVLG